MNDIPVTNRWGRFVRSFACASLAAAAVLTGFITLVDPYGIRVEAGDKPRPIVDINQRFMYPQLARSRQYNAAVFGTSSLRLLDPDELDRLFAASAGDVQFANLAMNASTPWEQMQLASLFLENEPAPRVLVFGLDRAWCDEDVGSPGKRLTFRTFPERFYDRERWNDWLDALNFKTLEIAGRLVSYRLGLREESIGDDGFAVFLPPDDFYDLDRARTHIWRAQIDAGKPATVVPEVPPAAPSAAEKAAWHFPAVAWLDGLLAQVPQSTQVYLLFPPAHVNAQPVPGSVAQVRDDVCKQRFTQMGARYNAAVLDFRRFSTVTREDANFWDPLHYRLPLATRIARAIGGVNASDEGDFYTFMRRRAPSLPSSGQ